VALKSMEVPVDEPYPKKMKTDDVYTAQGPSSRLSMLQSIGMLAAVLSDALDA
jgi:hypothetical protein